MVVVVLGGLGLLNWCVDYNGQLQLIRAFFIFFNCRLCSTSDHAVGMLQLAVVSSHVAVVLVCDRQDKVVSYSVTQ